ncbi:MAG: hypothetical protein V3S44_06050 [Alphaproteobacteria bacterium]
MSENGASDMTGDGDGRGYRELTPAERALSPYLHVEPCYVNVSKCLRVFGGYFREHYMQTSVKEPTPIAQIFNNHLLVTYACDAARERQVVPLAEALADPRPGALFCSTEIVERASSTRQGGQVARNRLRLPWPESRPVFIQYETYNCLSEIELRRMSDVQRLSMLCQIDIVKHDEIVVAPLFLGAETFDHFRNDDAALALTNHAASWFDCPPFDLGGFEAGGALPPVEEPVWRAALRETPGEALVALLGPAQARDSDGDIAFAETTLAGAPASVAMLGLDHPAEAVLDAATLYDDGNALVRLAGTPAEILVVRHGGAIADDARASLREVAVAPHAPRRYCAIDGGDTYRILRAAQVI